MAFSEYPNFKNLNKLSGRIIYWEHSSCSAISERLIWISPSVGWSSKSLANFDQQPGHSLIMLFSSTYVHIWAQGNVFKLRVDDFAKVLADLAQQKVVLGRPTGKDTLCKFLHFQNDLDSPFLDCSVHLWIGAFFDVIQIYRYFYYCQNII